MGLVDPVFCRVDAIVGVWVAGERFRVDVLIGKLTPDDYMNEVRITVEGRIMKCDSPKVS